MAVKIVWGRPEVHGWHEDSLGSIRGIWMTERIVWDLPEVVGWP